MQDVEALDAQPDGDIGTVNQIVGINLESDEAYPILYQMKLERLQLQSALEGKSFQTPSDGVFAELNNRELVMFSSVEDFTYQELITLMKVPAERAKIYEEITCRNGEDIEIDPEDQLIIAVPHLTLIYDRGGHILLSGKAEQRMVQNLNIKIPSLLTLIEFDNKDDAEKWDLEDKQSIRCKIDHEARKEL
ncbi:hypothetical protein PROFUN_10216 [Planoprotostelium fungivorum]|uniref:Uncharacterized protein n=1 Tax=Planoprotostelium fungivorum TaxID=1890364 RepID=A0A2P6MQ88_9EUKA|nr:hypothetical protein PROFUN_10216 [Planoprotostelium fungivorum]